MEVECEIKYKRSNLGENAARNHSDTGVADSCGNEQNQENGCKIYLDSLLA